MAWMPGTDGKDTIVAYGDGHSLFGGSEANPRSDVGPNTLVLKGGSYSTLVGSIAIDHFDAGTGVDNSVSYQLSTGPVIASLANPSINTGDARGDTYTNVYQLTGSLYGGALYGDTSGKVNQLWALGGTNELYGAVGYTTFISGPGADKMVGGAGRGLIDYETSKSAVTASIRAPNINTGEAAGDTYTNIFDMAGSRFSDILHGDDNPNNFLGGHSDDRGDDVFYGYGGSDTFTTGRGADTMFGGAQNDFFVLNLDDLADAREGKLQRIGDYNQGNTGYVSAAEYDGIGLGQLGLSPSSVRVVNGAGFATLQILDQGNWLSMARLDGLKVGDAVRVITGSNAAGSWISVDPASTGASVPTTTFKTTDIGTRGGTSWPVSGLGDFNGDGTSDILWRNPNSGQVDQWQIAKGNWSKSIDLGANKAANWEMVGAGDFNGDGTDDVLWRDAGNARVDQWQMKNGQWAKSLDHGANKGSDWQAAGIADFNGDGVDDVLWRKVGTAQVDQWQMKNGQWAKSLDHGAAKGADWAVAGLGDFNGDGTADVLWRKADSGQVDQWQMKNGQWAKSIDHGAAKGTDWKVAGVADFNGDGTDDIQWSNAKSGQVDVWLMRNGQWMASVDLGVQNPERVGVGAGDMNGDGKDDSLWLSQADGGRLHVWNGAADFAIA